MKGKEDIMVRKKLLHGIGINDVAYRVVVTKEYPKKPNGTRDRRQVWKCPYYSKWEGMLRRAAYTKYKKKHPTYEKCTVCEEWKTFSNFIAWVDAQPDTEWGSKDLDKDFIIEGNKFYSPETCVFIHSNVNKFILDNASCRGEYLIGVFKHKDGRAKPFKASCRDPLMRNTSGIGHYSTEIEAHNAWKICKHGYALELAERELDERVKHVLRTRYL